MDVMKMILDKKLTYKYQIARNNYLKWRNYNRIAKNKSQKENYYYDLMSKIRLTAYNKYYSIKDYHMLGNKYGVKDAFLRPQKNEKTSNFKRTLNRTWFFFGERKIL